MTDAPTNQAGTVEVKAETPFQHGGNWYLPCGTRVLTGNVYRRWERFDRHMRLRGTVLIGLHVSQREVIESFF